MTKIFSALEKILRFTKFYSTSWFFFACSGLDTSVCRIIVLTECIHYHTLKPTDIPSCPLHARVPTDTPLHSLTCLLFTETPLQCFFHRVTGFISVRNWRSPLWDFFISRVRNQDLVSLVKKLTVFYLTLLSFRFRCFLSTKNKGIFRESFLYTSKYSNLLVFCCEKIFSFSTRQIIFTRRS